MPGNYKEASRLFCYLMVINGSDSFICDSEHLWQRNIVSYCFNCTSLLVDSFETEPNGQYAAVVCTLLFSLHPRVHHENCRRRKPPTAMVVQTFSALNRPTWTPNERT